MRNNQFFQSINQFFGILTSANLKQLLLIFFMMFVVMFLEMLGVGLIIPMIKFLLNADYVYSFPTYVWLAEFIFGTSNPQNKIYFGILIILLIFLCKALFLSFYIHRQTFFIFDINRTISERLFQTYLKQPYIFHINNNSSKLIQNVVAEVGMFSGMVVTSFLYIATEMFILLGILSVLLYVEPLGTLTIAGSFFLFAFIYNLLTKSAISRWGEWRQIADTRRIQSIQEGIMGIKQSLLLGRIKFFIDKFNLQNTKSCKVNSNQTLVLSLPKIWLEFLAIVTIFILVFFISENKNAGVEEILPTLALFGAAAFKVLPSINRILNSSQQMRFAVPNISKLYNELNVTIPRNLNLKSFPKIKLKKKLSLKNLYFAYPGSKKNILSSLSLDIFFGECIGIVGMSGAGKSTLVDNILGLFTPQSGSITVDGVNINDNIRSWQNEIGYVSQNLYLTDDSIKSNIAFGISPNKVDIRKVNKSIRMAQLTEFIKSLPEGLNTNLGEGGIKLSGGQRQRIGIARALYHNPSLIVLDEATNALDTKTEKGIMDAVLELKGKKTIIIIAHKMSTLDKCDRIFKISANGSKEVNLVPSKSKNKIRNF